MVDEEKDDYTKLKAAMLQAFGVNCYAAYDQPQKAGLPIDISIPLKSMAFVETLSLSDLVVRATLRVDLNRGIDVMCAEVAHIWLRIVHSKKEGPKINLCPVSQEHVTHAESKATLQNTVCKGLHLCRVRRET